jgi:phosphopantetheine--protein transferase-like protein
MVVGVGIDICENDRISEMLGKYRDRFLNRVFTPEEVSYCLKKKDPIPHLAARFAVKEAFIKALGMRRDLTISYRDVGLRVAKAKKIFTLRANSLPCSRSKDCQQRALQHLARARLFKRLRNS